MPFVASQAGELRQIRLSARTPPYHAPAFELSQWARESPNRQELAIRIALRRANGRKARRTEVSSPGTQLAILPASPFRIWRCFRAVVPTPKMARNRINQWTSGKREESRSAATGEQSDEGFRFGFVWLSFDAPPSERHGLPLRLPRRVAARMNCGMSWLTFRIAPAIVTSRNC